MALDSIHHIFKLVVEKKNTFTFWIKRDQKLAVYIWILSQPQWLCTTAYFTFQYIPGPIESIFKKWLNAQTMLSRETE